MPGRTSGQTARILTGLSFAQCRADGGTSAAVDRSEEHTSELQSQSNLVCRLLLEKKKKTCHQSIYDRHDLRPERLFQAADRREHRRRADDFLRGNYGTALVCTPDAAKLQVMSSE